MEKPFITFVENKSRAVTINNVNREIIRKGIHSLIAFVPLIASYNISLAIFLLLSGIIVYLLSEYFRITYRNNSLISRITNLVSRQRECNYPVFGPATLGIGAILSLLFFPLPVARIAIFALAFGDGIASIAGNRFSSIEIPHTQGKTFAGSFACFIVIYLIVFRYSFSMPKAFMISGIATFLEALPLDELDNIVLPVGVGFLSIYLRI